MLSAYVSVPFRCYPPSPFHIPDQKKVVKSYHHSYYQLVLLPGHQTQIGDECHNPRLTFRDRISFLLLQFCTNIFSCPHESSLQREKATSYKHNQHDPIYLVICIVFLKNAGLKVCILHFFTLQCLYLNYSQLIITNLSICKEINIYILVTCEYRLHFISPDSILSSS